MAACLAIHTKRIIEEPTGVCQDGQHYNNDLYQQIVSTPIHFGLEHVLLGLWQQHWTAQQKANILADLLS